MTSPGSSLPARPAGGIGDPSEFLALMGRILVHAGWSPRELDERFHQICSSGLPEPDGTRNPAHLNFLTALPELIARWYEDAKFLDAEGEPAQLPLTSSDVSFSSLVEEVLPGEEPRSVLEALIRLRAITDQGDGYVPTDRQVRYTGKEGWVYTLHTLLGMLRTVAYNVTCATEDSTIHERTALHQRFPVAALPIFHEWFKKQAHAFLWSVHRRMRHLAKQRRSEPTTCLGVGIFGFEDPMVTGTSERTAHPTSPAPKDPDPGRGGKRARRKRDRG